ncbi:HD-GYP domain-containing protein [Acidaminobacter hydrogenoformans]|uniref:HDIG domain-containing protein n=1 Tax=Acidaminobacter hydrogenoformans DSM 2784 TaxID=1120920 RepID=A0A1G5S2L8_9FIRM|nr:HD-GYP domain-containing protein [Acidaminobacter hydrogenoformans]SCZ80553.1 HDIG domain-containing protein [Acidaminobacter hydrogenoformans DSM 2784]
MKHNNIFRIFTTFIILFGFLIIFEAVQMISAETKLTSVLFFALLSLLAESMVIQVNDKKYVSLGFAIGLAAILIFDPYIAAAVNFLGTFFSIYYSEGKYHHIFNSSVYKRLFNGSAYAIGSLVAGNAYQMSHSVLPAFTVAGFGIVSIIVAVAVNVFINISIFIILFALLDRFDFKGAMHEMVWIVQNFIGISPIGVFMAILYVNSGWFMVLLVLGPLLVARYSFKLYLDMKNQYFETIKTLSNALDAKDEYTNGHSHRVAQISMILAKEMKIPVLLIDEIKTAAILHDIGKIGISDTIINKPGRLEDHEMAIIQKHPEIGANIVKDVKSLEELSSYIRYHHERYDGKGYPEGIAGETIPIEAAIIAVSDSFDAMTSDRVYRKAMSFEVALSIVKEERGKQFHPEVVDAFVRCAERGQIPKTHEMM